MMHDAEFILAQTRIEERDGDTWVSGLCPYCWERLAFPVSSVAMEPTVRCPNGHSLRIADRRSEGSSADAPRPGQSRSV
ncbi:MAG TPA: hypothetical protein VKU41_22615 [Polyangiaceae bacterium]|nr:hypothetical protein [Polyangiaceae bacterium]